MVYLPSSETEALCLRLGDEPRPPPSTKGFAFNITASLHILAPGNTHRRSSLTTHLSINVLKAVTPRLSFGTHVFIKPSKALTQPSSSTHISIQHISDAHRTLPLAAHRFIKPSSRNRRRTPDYRSNPFNIR